MVCNILKKLGIALVIIAVVLLFTGCNRDVESLTSDEPKVQSTVSEPEQSEPIVYSSTETSVTVETSETVETSSETHLWTDEELQAIALTLAGECYDDKVEDKRLVCEVILNRVSDGRYGGNTVIEVLSAESQFNGYWHQPRKVSENDLEVAEQALNDWYNNGCKALSDYYFFSAGDNRENVFRSEY